MSTIEEQIEGVLIARMQTLSLSPALPVEWPNRDGAPPAAGTAHLRVRHIRNDNTRLFLRGNAVHLRQGILQVDVMTPRGGGTAAANAIAGAVAQHFPADLDLYGETVRVKIEAAPTVHSAIPADAWWQTPVSIRYRAFA